MSPQRHKALQAAIIPIEKFADAKKPENSICNIVANVVSRDGGTMIKAKISFRGLHTEGNAARLIDAVKKAINKMIEPLKSQTGKKKEWKRKIRKIKQQFDPEL